MAAAAAIAGGLTVTNAGSASADPCPSEATCAYASENWAGRAAPVYENNEDLTPYYSWRNAESIYNNGRYCNVAIYSAKNYGGVRYPLNRGTGWKSIRGSAIWHHAYSNYWC